jgi:hypothetical protein
MCFAVKGRLQGRAAKLLLARRKSWYNANLGQICLAANGPAIWGGCVTRREHRAGSWYFSQKVVTVQGGYGAVFAVMVQFFCVLARSRYNFDASDIFITGYKFYALHWRSVAVQIVSEAEISHGAGF